MSTSEWFWMIFDVLVLGALIIAYGWPLWGPIIELFLPDSDD